MKAEKHSFTYYSCSCCGAKYDDEFYANRCCTNLGYIDQEDLWDKHLELFEYDRPNRECGHGRKYPDR